MATMTITVPTGKSGEMAFFNIELIDSLEETLENIEMLVKPSDVMLAEEMGFWKVI
jgi:hypothetical protein